MPSPRSPSGGDRSLQPGDWWGGEPEQGTGLGRAELCLFHCPRQHQSEQCVFLSAASEPRSARSHFLYTRTARTAQINKHTVSSGRRRRAPPLAVAPLFVGPLLPSLSHLQHLLYFQRVSFLRLFQRGANHFPGWSGAEGEKCRQVRWWTPLHLVVALSPSPAPLPLSLGQTTSRTPV